MFIALDDIPEGVVRNYDALRTAGTPVVTYNNFIIYSSILAFSIFMMVRFLNCLHRQQQAALAKPTEEVILLREISEKLGNNIMVK